jgi:hypothetical protein
MPSLAVVLALVVLPTLVAEAGVRALVAFDRLPVAAAHIGQVEFTWTNLANLGTADVIVFGDSMTQQGFEPQTLATALEPLVGRRPTTFNLATPGGGFGVNMALAAQLAREGRLPKVALVGVSYSSMYGDGTFRNAFAPSPMGQLFTDCALETKVDDWLGCKLSGVSYAWRWRGHPGRIVSAVLHPLKTSSDHASGLFVRADGFRSGKPATVAEIQAQIPKAIADLTHFSLGAGVEASYVSLIRTLVDGGSTVVVFGVPASPPYRNALEAAQPGFEQVRVNSIAQLAAATGVPIIDPVSMGSWWGDGSSRDVNHLSREGAPQFVHQLMGAPEFRDPIVARLRQ